MSTDIDTPTKTITPEQRNKLNASMYTASNMVSRFMGILHTIKLFHWKTLDYALHKATDDLHGSLSSKVDEFVEQLMGILSSRINVTPANIRIHDCNSIDELIHYISIFKIYLRRMEFPTHQYDLLTIRDEMMGLINRFLYLASLK